MLPPYLQPIFTVNSITLGVVLLISALLIQDVNAHGYMDILKARQQFCVDDGGYWWPDDGSAIPNIACRAAFLVKGTKQWVQHHEFSENVVDYNDMSAVKLAIPNGQLCAGGDVEKSGVDLPSQYWQRSDVTLDNEGKVQIVFDAHTPHNPSFWQFYLSSKDFNAAEEIFSWEKLELIAEVGDLAVTDIEGKKVYEMMIPFPIDRSGEATLYTRWQREDIAGEGFYNCSDINILTDDSPIGWSTLAPYVINGVEVKVGQEVWFRLFSAQGEELIFEKLLVDESHTSAPIWTQVMAD